MDLLGSMVFDAFMDASGLGGILEGILAVIVLPMIIWNTLVCLFGYKLFKIQLAIIGFLVGAALGAVLGATGGEAIFAVLLGLALGALGAWLALKLYKLGVFIAVSSCSTLILIVLLALLTQSFSGGIVVLAVLLGIGLGVLGVLMDKIIIILYTAIAGGMLAGIGLGLSMGNAVIGVFIGVLLAVLGVWLQFRMERKTGGQPVGLAAAPAALSAPPKAAPALALGDMAKSLTASAKGATDFLMSKVGKHENLNPNQTVLVSNKGNYWCNDMPLVVTEVQVASQAGDEERVYLNIALQNLSNQPIVGIYFDVTCQNLLKQELEGLVNLSVLDLHIAEGQHWFTTTSIRLPDKTTRKCLLTVKNVVLKNEEIWSNEQGLPLTDIPAVGALALSSELAEEYHLQLAEQQKMRNAAAVYTYAPSFAAEHWYCSCGQLNTTSSQCICCAMDKAMLADMFDESKLQAGREHRIAEKLWVEEERRQKIAEQTEAVKQKSLELAGQAKQGYAAAATKTAELYGVAAAKAKEWYTAAKVFVVGHKKQVLAGVGAVAVVVVGGVAIKAMLDRSAATPVQASSGSSATSSWGTAAASAPTTVTAVGEVSQGLVVVECNGLYGYVDVNGLLVIPCIYESAQPFVDGKAVVVLDGTENMISLPAGVVWTGTARPVVSVQETEAAQGLDRTEGFVYGSEGYEKCALAVRWGAYEVDNANEAYFVDRYGNRTEPPYPDTLVSKFGLDHITFSFPPDGDPLDSLPYIPTFSDGLAAVKEDGLWGFIDGNGVEVIPFIYDRVHNFSEGLAPVSQNNKWGYIDTSGNMVIPFMDAISASEFFNGHAMVYGNNMRDNYIIDKTGQQVSRDDFTWSRESSEGLMKASRGEQYGYVDKAGNTVIPFIFNNATSFSDGLAAVKQGDYYGFINKAGEIVIPYTYKGRGLYNGPWSNFQTFKDGLALVTTEDKIQIIDKTGQAVYEMNIPEDALDEHLENVGKNLGDGVFSYLDYLITVDYVTETMLAPDLAGLSDAIYSFSQGVLLQRQGDITGGNALIRRAMDTQPNNPYLSVYLVRDSADALYKTPADRAKLYNDTLQYYVHAAAPVDSNILENHGIAQLVAANKDLLAQYSQTPNTADLRSAKLNIRQFDYRYAVSLDDFNLLAEQLLGDAALGFLTSDFESTRAGEILSTLSDPSAISFKGLQADIVYLPSLQELVIGYLKSAETAQKLTVIEDSQSDGTNIVVNTQNIIICLGEYGSKGFKVTVDGTQPVVLDRYGEVPISREDFDRLMQPLDYETLEKLFGELCKKYGLSPIVETLSLNPTANIGAGSGMTVDNITFDNGASDTADTAEMAAITADNAFEPATVAFWNYYMTFLNAINKLDGSLIEYCSAAQQSRQDKRIFEFNSEYTFDNISMMLDQDSYSFTYENGVPTVYFNVRCENDMWKRDVEDARTQTNLAPQSAVIIYENGEWVVMQTVRSDYIKVGNNLVDISK